MLMSLVLVVLAGFFVGLVARAVLPGAQRMGLLLTTILGIAGSLAAGFLGESAGIYRAGEGAGVIASVFGAIVLLYVVSRLKGASHASDA
jgi:uncharacterized membrane protein YeaQ/YmgE (transglycosylase-associated protein family)